MKHRIIFTLLILTVCLIFAGCDVILNTLGNTPSEHTHSFSEEVKRPTPKEQGYTTYTCECGYSYVDNYVDISPSKRLKFEFNSKKDGYELVDLGYCDDVDVVIPATHNMLPVTGISDHAFLGASNIRSVTIPASITSIGDEAFFYCSGLTDIYVDEGNPCYKSIDGNLYSKDGTTLVRYAIGRTSSLVEIPDGVTSIGSFAFATSENLVTITIPEHVTNIDAGAFKYCYNLSKIEVDENNLAYKTIDGNLYSKDGHTLVQYVIKNDNKDFTVPEDVMSIGGYAFSGCKNLARVSLPSSVTDIGVYAFEYCDSLETVTMSENAGSIDKGAFSNCKKLANITIPSGVTGIGDYSFEYCLSLAIITIPDSVESIGNHAFGNQENDFIICCETASAPSGWNPNWCAQKAVIVWDCKNNDVAVDGHIYVVKDSVRYVIKDGSATVAKQSKNIAVAIICESITYKGASYPVTSIGYGAFGSCKNLTSVTVPGSVTDIGSSAFSSCDSLKSITLPNSVTHVAGNAFYSFSDLIIYCEAESKPDGWDSRWCNSNIVVVWDCQRIYVTVDGIRYGIKDGVAAVVKQSEDIAVAIILESISYEGILYPVTSIRDGAFKDCENLTSVTVPASVTSIGKDTFRNCKSLTDVTLTEGIVEIGESAFRNCTNLKSIIVPNGVITIGDSAFEDCLKLTTITLPDSITSLNSNVFRLCLNLIDIDIPKNVTSIGNGAFRGCQKLTSVNIPDGVTSIGDFAFNGCEKLTSVTIPLGVTSIGNGAFEGCYDLVNITIPDSVTYIGEFAFINCLDLTNITIPVGVTSIGNSTFAGCTSLTSIIIPKGVTSIGDRAFYGCEKLTSVTIPSSVTHIGEYAFYECNMLKSAIFENASGWYYGETLVATEYLLDPSVAAILIINYYLYSWHR